METFFIMYLQGCKFDLMKLFCMKHPAEARKTRSRDSALGNVLVQLRTPKVFLLNICLSSTQTTKKLNLILQRKQLIKILLHQHLSPGKDKFWVPKFKTFLCDQCIPQCLNKVKSRVFFFKNEVCYLRNCAKLHSCEWHLPAVSATPHKRHPLYMPCHGVHVPPHTCTT